MLTEFEGFAEQGPDLVYADYLATGDFRIQQCGSCDRHVFYPRLACPHCGAAALRWVSPSGEGTVYSTSVPRDAKEGDYNIAIVELAEGPRLMSRVVDIDPEKVTIGMRVSAFIGEIDGTKVVLFRPAGEEN